MTRNSLCISCLFSVGYRRILCVEYYANLIACPTPELQLLSGSEGQTTMADFTKDELEFALTTLDQLMKSRDLNQTQLAHASGVPQSTISKLLSPTRGHEPT